MREALVRAARAVAGWLWDRQRVWSVDEHELYRQLRRSARRLAGAEGETVRAALERSAEAIRMVYDGVAVEAPKEPSRAELRRLYGLYLSGFSLLAAPPAAREAIVGAIRRLSVDVDSAERAAEALREVEPGDHAAAGERLARLVADSVYLPRQLPTDFWKVLVINQLRSAATAGPAAGRPPR